VSGESTLAGVSLEITATDCTFTVAEAAAGIEIPYQIVVSAAVPNVYPARQGGCKDADASGLYPFEKLTGGTESYCRCDEGLCPGPGPDPVTLPAGTYPGIFQWDGVNWSGPSDTGNPKGPPFPPGDYTLVVSANGQFENGGAKDDFLVSATAVIHLLP